MYKQVICFVFTKKAQQLDTIVLLIQCVYNILCFFIFYDFLFMMKKMPQEFFYLNCWVTGSFFFIFFWLFYSWRISKNTYINLVLPCTICNPNQNTPVCGIRSGTPPLSIVCKYTIWKREYFQEMYMEILYYCQNELEKSI